MAPGSPCTADEFKLGVQYLEQKGFKVRFDKNIFTSLIVLTVTSDAFNAFNSAVVIYNLTVTALVIALEGVIVIFLFKYG